MQVRDLRHGGYKDRLIEAGGMAEIRLGEDLNQTSALYSIHQE